MRTTRKLIALVFAFGVTSCSQPKNTRTDDIEGRPPTAAEDPFFFVAIPADAQKVETRGTIEMPARRESDVARASGTVPDRIPDRVPTSVQCFACVQVCNVDGGRTLCEGREDIICGWGVHPERDVASRLATAECDGALDIARESTRFARIEGSCPVATCR